MITILSHIHLPFWGVLGPVHKKLIAVVWGVFLGSGHFMICEIHCLCCETSCSYAVREPFQLVGRKLFRTFA